MGVRLCLSLRDFMSVGLSVLGRTIVLDNQNAGHPHVVGTGIAKVQDLLPWPLKSQMK